jgi:hypothetical protein
MSNQNNSGNIEQLLKVVSERLGTTPDKLKQAIAKGGVNDIANIMRPDDAKKFKETASKMKPKTK